MSEHLFELVIAHCFWGWCDHKAEGIDPDAVHDLMERHYATAHRADIDLLLPRVTIRAGLIA